MNKRIIYRAALLVLVTLLSALAVIPFQRADEDRPHWMAELDDGAALCSLSIPGTHDSGALHSFADVFGKCQTLPISHQLKIGVRFLDIRLQLVDNKLKIVHSIADQMTDFKDVLTDMLLFLRENPSEFLLVSFKEDASPKRSDVDFAETLEQMLPCRDEVSREQALPKTVGDARGRLHIIARYRGASIGLPCYEGWADDTSFVLGDLYVQDNYNVKSSKEKLSDVASTFDTSAEMKYSLVLNYTSCYVSPSFPPVYAGIPAHSINSWLGENLSLTREPLGVLVCDFITSELSGQIIGRNFE